MNSITEHSTKTIHAGCSLQINTTGPSNNRNTGLKRNSSTTHAQQSLTTTRIYFFKVQQQTTWDHMGETISATYFAKYSRLCLLTTTGSNF